MVEPEDEPDVDRPRPQPMPAKRPADEPVDEPADESVGARGAPVDRHRPRKHGAHKHGARQHQARNRATMLAALVVTVAVIIAVVLIVVDDRSSSSNTTATASDTSATITDSAAANAFMAGATSDVVAVTTYDYRSLDTALSNGQLVTTGAYRTSFQSALTGSLGSEAKRVHRIQTFQLLAAGIGEISKDGTSAKVLTFGVQSVSDDSTGGKARQTLVTLTATIERQSNRYLIADLTAGQNAGLPAGTAGLRAAAEAGRAEVAAVLTLRHDHFDTDYDTALAGAVDPLRTNTLTSQAAATRQRITKGGYDLAGTVTAVGIQQALGDTVVLLVAATGTRTSGGKTSVVSDGRCRATVVLVSGRWVTTSIVAVTAS